MVYAPSRGPARAVFGTHSIVLMVRLSVLSFISKETEYALAGGPFFGKGTSQENFHRVQDPILVDFLIFVDISLIYYYAFYY